MTTSKSENTRISLAVSNALRAKGLSHADVAKILGMKEQSVSNAVSLGHFSEKVARKWSKALDIPLGVFIDGAAEDILPNSYGAIMNQIMEMKRDIEFIRK